MIKDKIKNYKPKKSKRKKEANLGEPKPRLISQTLNRWNPRSEFNQKNLIFNQFNVEW